MQICISLHTDNHVSAPPLSFLQTGCSSCHPTNSIKALMVTVGAKKHITCIDPDNNNFHPLSSYSVLAADALCDLVTLVFNLLTFNCWRWRCGTRVLGHDQGNNSQRWQLYQVRVASRQAHRLPLQGFSGCLRLEASRNRHVNLH